MKFTKTHEWVTEKEGMAVMGITDHAQSELSDIVHVELPEVGKKVTAGDSLMVVESVKAASDIYAPVSGEVVEVNSALEDSPELVNTDAEGEGWLVKLRLEKPEELQALLDHNAYKELMA